MEMNDLFKILMKDSHVTLTCTHEDNGNVDICVDIKGIAPVIEEDLYNIFMSLYEKEPSIYINATERVLKELKK